MPTVRYRGGGGYRIRDGPAFQDDGDEADVGEGTATRLTDRPDFELVTESADADAADEDSGNAGAGLEWDPNAHTVDEVRDYVGSVDGDSVREWLEAALAAEQSGKDRTTAKEAIRTRLADLEG